MAVAVAEKPSLVVHPHALTGDGRVLESSAFLPSETLGAYIKRTGVVVPAGPVVVWHNGYRVPDALWRRLIPRQGDQVIIRARVMGGGGGGNKVLRTVAMIAVVVISIFAPYLAPAAWGTIGATGAVTMTGALLSAGIMMAGTLLINSLLPPMQPTANALGSGSKYESSPTYAISGGRNRMRLWEPMIVVFGRHKVVPDLGAKPYSEYVGGDQYLNQIFHFGLQPHGVTLTDFKIGDTSLGSYQGVQLGISWLDGKLPMFPGNVDTLQGFSLASGVVNTRTTGQDVTYIAVEMVAQLFYVRDDGGMEGRTVDLRLQYRSVGSETWTDIGTLTDAVYATHYWSLTQDIQEQSGDSGYSRSTVQVDYGSTNAADHTDGEQVVITPASGSGSDWDPRIPAVMGTWRWKPHPFQLGRPWQGIAPDPLLYHSTTPGLQLYGAGQDPVRSTTGWYVPKGQYEVRVWKVDADIKNSRESNEVAINQILSIQTDEADYTGQLRVSLRIKASEQLNGAVDELSAIAHGSCAVWTGSEWTWKHTRNPAWWFLHFAYGARTESGQRVYGGGLENSQIDYECIKAWAAWCDTKGLTFDYVLDRKISTAQMLQIIARAGRASPTWQTGKLGVIWDAAELPVVAMFGPFNIKAGSFGVAYINESTADEIVMNFTNPARNWEMDEVRVRVPGATTTNNPLHLDFDGCTDPVMAGKEANLLAASQVWHRRRVSWETDIEGWVANRGDVVQISHDLTVWGYSGRLMGRSGNTITLDKPVPSAGTGTLMLRGPENQMRVVPITSAVDEVSEMTITADMSDFPLPGDEGYEDIVPMDWAWFFDPMATPGRRFKITEVQPSEDGVKFSAIDDDAGYYASENDPYLYTPPRDGSYLAGVVFGIQFTEALVNVLADISNVQIRWTLSVSMPALVAVSINGQPQPAVLTSERSITVQAQTGDVVTVTVTPKSDRGAGTPSTMTYTVMGLTAPLPALTGLTNVFRDGLTVLVWDRVVDIRQPVYEVRIGESWANSRTVAIVPTLETLALGNGLYWVAARFAARGTVVYGPADSLSISGASLVRNVLLTEVEHPAWAGALGDGAVIHGGELTLAGIGDVLASADILPVDDILWYGGAAPSGTYQSANTVDIGFVLPVHISFDIDAYALNFGENVLSMVDVLASADILNASNSQHWRVRPQIRHAGDDAIYTAWRDYTPGLINARYFQVRLVIETDDPLIVPFIQAFTWVVDVPDMIDRAENVTVPSAGMAVVYAHAFHAVPNVQITWLDAIDGDRYVLANQSETGFDIQFFNGATAVSRVMNRISQGY